jgi:trigger factor
MRSEVAANVEREVRKRLQARTKEQVMQALLNAHPMDVPKALIEQESGTMADAAIQDLANRGVDIKNVPVERGWFTDQATRRVKLGLILAELVKEKGLHAKADQVRAQVDELSQSYEDPAEVVRWYYSQPERIAQVEALAIEENVMQWVLANVRASDKAITFDELMGNAA